MNRPFDGMKPSEVVQAFLDWLADVKADQERNWDITTREDEKIQDFLHELEFAEGEPSMGEIAKRWHDSRIVRRNAKDRSKALKPIKDYMDDATCKAHIKRLNRLVKDLQQVEEFLGSDRVYKPRARSDDTMSYEEAQAAPVTYMQVGGELEFEFAEPNDNAETSE